jgi:hypothetical protein
VRFDGIDDGLAIPFNLSPSENASVTIFSVFSSEPVPKEQLRKLYGHDDGGFDRATGFDQRASTPFSFFAGSGGAKLYPGVAAGAIVLTTDVWTPTTFNGYVNGQLQVNNAPQNAGAGNATMALGGIRQDTAFPGDQNQARPGGYEPWHGLIAEFLIYNRALATDERQRVETYLKTKYNIA